MTTSKILPKVIVLAGDVQYDGAQASTATIRPGMLLERLSTDKVQPHSVAAGKAQMMFADFEPYAGSGIDTLYALNDHVNLFHASSGTRVYALIANGVNASIGSYLESNGDGTLRVSTHAATNATTASAWPVAVAREALNNTSGSAARLIVEIL